jgi:hypothetical protein
MMRKRPKPTSLRRVGNDFRPAIDEAAELLKCLPGEVPARVRELLASRIVDDSWQGYVDKCPYQGVDGCCENEHAVLPDCTPGACVLVMSPTQFEQVRELIKCARLASELLDGLREDFYVGDILTPGVRDLYRDIAEELKAALSEVEK